MSEAREGALAGAVAAVVWAAAGPLLRRSLSTPYSDVRFAGRLATTGRYWPIIGLGLHTAAGAVLGVLFVRAGVRGKAAAIAAAEVENAAMWPAMLVADRLHPDVRSGRWPKLFGNRRVFAQASLGHALFGIVVASVRRHRQRRAAGATSY
jgi:hypothetical protein